MKTLAEAATETDAPKETGALTEHILTRYHEMHRANLASPIPFADRVARVHADDPDAPNGLAVAIRALAREMEDHMAKEEMFLFPAMRAGGGTGTEHPIAVMRGDHQDHAETIVRIRQITNDLTPPDHACGSWRSLYVGVAALIDDLDAHISLEHEELFSCFEPQ